MQKFKLYFLIFCCFFLWISSAAFAQLSVYGIPQSFLLEIHTKDVPIINMPYVDVKKLLLEDEAFANEKDIPWRFGDNISVNLDVIEMAHKHTIDSQGHLYRIAIHSPDAYSLNFTFDNYLLPPGAKLFIYNQDKSTLLGAFTHLNNQDDLFFATSLVQGDFAIIEYFEPFDVPFRGELQLQTVTHAYRNPYDYAKGFGDSGSCNLNVACDEALGYENQINSVVLLLTGSNGFCSGVLINNTNEDKTPYILSANHCYRNPATVVFWFNWQSKTCENPTNPPMYNSLSGSSSVARYNDSDFWLLEANQSIPTYYNAYFAGWNRTTLLEMSEKITAVHHPRGDIKKFSYALDGLETAAYASPPGSGTTHWRITWSGGTTTEGGSSGSPIFDSHGRILGQLHGGYAACGNTLPDWYGRFNVSWNGGGTSSSRLRDWLDPQGLNPETWDGIPLSPNYVFNPKDFEIHQDVPGSVQLSWQLNTDENYVMIAVNDTDTFDNPQNGYSVGESMDNGAEIIYLGGGDGFLYDTERWGEKLYFTIWSYNLQNHYSTGLIDSLIVDCPDFILEEYSQNFDKPDDFPCWSQERVQGETTWLWGQGNNDGNPSQPYMGEGNMFFRTFTTSEIGNKTKLITPTLFFENVESVSLSFYYVNPADIANQDILRVLYWDSQDQDWVLLQQYGANVGGWTWANINLPETSWSNGLKLAFEGEGFRGKGISLDNISIQTQKANVPQAPIGLSFEMQNVNRPIISWEMPQEKDMLADMVALTGFKILKNNQTVFHTEDPEQRSWLDHSLPIGETVYTIFALGHHETISSPSDPLVVTVEDLGDNHILEFSRSGQGMVNLVEGTYVFQTGSLLSLNAQAQVHHELQYWQVNTEYFEEMSIELLIQSDLDVTAVFVPIKYFVQITAEPEEAAANITPSNEFEYGDYVHLFTSPQLGFVFQHWADSQRIVSTRPEALFSINGSESYTAHFIEKDYDVSVAVQPSNGGKVSGTGVFPAGSQVLLTAETFEGFLFEGWFEYGDLISENLHYQFHLNADRLLVARFENLFPTTIEDIIWPQDEEEGLTFSVFPNPAKDILNLKINRSIPLRYSVYNAMGITLLEKEMQKPENIEQIFVGAYKAGLYFLVLHTETEQQVIRFVVK